jgi:diadenosine tetraphosphate (Ap4A) HIT family hydrolase
MADIQAHCILCRGESADYELNVIEVWHDDLWRMTMSLEAEVPGFCYLEPKRHIPHITDLDGEEAQTLGAVLAKVTSVLKAETIAELVYVFAYGGGIPHLHLHLAPHRKGDALNEQLIRGEIVSEQLPNGTTRFISTEFPPLPEEVQRDVARRVQQRLSSS